MRSRDSCRHTPQTARGAIRSGAELKCVPATDFGTPGSWPHRIENPMARVTNVDAIDVGTPFARFVAP
eukprot:3441489-Pyramimonas_sp.AAC.1